MKIVTTHKGVDFDALASVVAANMLYPGVVTVLPECLNPNVSAFLSLHQDFFGYCTSLEIDLEKVQKLIVVDTDRWERLDRLGALAKKPDLDITLFDHHEDSKDITASWQCRESMGANITLMLRYLKQRKLPL